MLNYPPQKTITACDRNFWLTLSLSFAIICALMGLQKAFSAEYVVQDDARQHVFWMQRFLDKDLLPNDLIADYFQSIAPAGYTQLYQLIANLGISPFLLNKLLPIALAVITTLYSFHLCMGILPIPLAGFISTLILNQSIWMKDDLVSATPRAFVYPLFLAFLYYLQRQSLLPCLVAIALTGLFYPQYVLVESGILILQWGIGNGESGIGHRAWEDKGTRGQGDKGDKRNPSSPSSPSLLSLHPTPYTLHPSAMPNAQCYPPPTPPRRGAPNAQFALVGLAIALAVMLPYVLKTSDFGPAIALADAKNLPEFWPGGRSEFFDPNPYSFWITSKRSGFVPARMAIASWLGLLLPLLLLYPQRFPLLKKLSSRAIVLPQIALVAFSLFLAAHALLFRLHLPARYTTHSLQVVLALASGIVLAVFLDALFNWFSPAKARIAAVLVLLVLVLYPISVDRFPRTYYKTGKATELYRFLQKQPKDITIASLAEEANNLPSFSQRSILVGREYAIPYHVGYYSKFRERTLALVRAQYSPDLAAARELIKKYDIDFWLLERSAFAPDYLAENRWLKGFLSWNKTEDKLVLAVREAFAASQDGTLPALANIVEPCSAFETEKYIVLDGKCVGGNGE